MKKLYESFEKLALECILSLFVLMLGHMGFDGLRNLVHGFICK